MSVGESDSQSDDFESIVRSNVGCAVILAGSGSDEDYIDRISLSLQKYRVAHEVRIASAHKQVERLQEVINYYDALSGILVYIAVAGGTDALSGTLSYVSWRPTISCPPDHCNTSCLTDPLGSSNAYIGRPENAARFVAQVFASHNKECRTALEAERASKHRTLESDDLRLRMKYARAQGR